MNAARYFVCTQVDIRNTVVCASILWYGTTYRRTGAVSPARVTSRRRGVRVRGAEHVQGAPFMHHILVIDDDALFRDSLATTLHRAGYAVTARADAHDLEALLTAESFHAIITDLYMPECDGI